MKSKKTLNMRALSALLASTLAISAVFAPTAFAQDIGDTSQIATAEESSDFTPADAINDTDIQKITEKKSVLDESDIIYMILTDRFYDSDSSNNGTLGVEYRPGELKYTQGGDWNGITQKLDYIKDLGVTAIWISPPSENELLSRDGEESGYHGYFTHDYNSADPHYGTKEDLINLVSTAHEKGLKVILDVVPNHTADYFNGSSSTYDSDSYQPAAPFNNPDWYHHFGDITDWSDENQVLNYDLGGLDDLNQDNPDARQAIKDAYKAWVEDTGADGVRIDAARSLPKDFIQEFENYLGVPSFGEIFVGDVDYVSDFSNYEWGVLDFPLFFQAREVFAHDASFTTVKSIFDQDSKYNDVNHLVTFIDNHDRDRFLCLAGDNYQKLRLALTFIFTVRGIPDVYYGTEQNCYGGGVPTEWAADQGYSWWLERLSMSFELFDYVRIDHFRGFESYYAIPAKDKTAENGCWRQGPGKDFINAIKDRFGDPHIIAEDLGFLTKEVKDLLQMSGFPGMKVLQFAFDTRESNNYLPYTYVKNCVVYTGTHDNDTLHGWTLSAAPEDVRYAKEYIDYSTDRGSLERQLIRVAMASVGDTVIIPIQDWLELGSEARINQPSTLGCNWLWRMNAGTCTSALANEISRMTELYGR